MNSRIFLTLFLAVFAATTGVGLVVPLLPVYAHQLGANAFEIGLMFGSFSVSRSIFVPLFGMLSDKKGRKPFLILGLFLYLGLSIGYMFSTRVHSLILVRLAQGFASAMILPVAQAYVGMITPAGREGFTMGLFNVALFSGLSIGPLLGGFFRDWLGIQASFLSMAVLTLIGLLLCVVFLPPEKTRSRRENPRSESALPYTTILMDRSILPLLVFRTCFTTSIGIIWSFLPLLASVRVGLSSSSIGVLVMINVFISGALQTPMGFVADRFSKPILIIAGGILAALSVVFIQTADSFGGLFLANALHGLAGGISFPAVMAMGVMEGRRTRAMGAVMGLLAMAHSVGMFAGPLLAGYLLDHFSFSVIFTTGSLILIAGTGFFVLCRRPKEKKQVQ